MSSCFCKVRKFSFFFFPLYARHCDFFTPPGRRAVSPSVVSGEPSGKEDLSPFPFFSSLKSRTGIFFSSPTIWLSRYDGCPRVPFPLDGGDSGGGSDALLLFPPLPAERLEQDAFSPLPLRKSGCSTRFDLFFQHNYKITSLFPCLRVEGMVCFSFFPPPPNLPTGSIEPSACLFPFSRPHVFVAGLFFSASF